MKIGGAHLTYCSNIHPAESWPETFAALSHHIPPIKAQVAPDAPFGIGLRLSARAAAELAGGDALDEFRAYLRDANAYVFTINGFPYGDFHGTRVKEQVYAPDWQSADRLTYTNRLADILAALLPDDVETGSISTVPGSFAPWAKGNEAAMAEGLITATAHLVALRARTGKTITLALEPEPWCFLETVAEAVAFFRAHLHSDAAAYRLAALSGLTVTDAATALRRHLGLCYDVCHAALAYEDAAGSVKALQRAGIGIFKLQLSSALRFAAITPDSAARLRPFDEPTYLHQVIERAEGGSARKWPDLGAALAEIDSAMGREWRVHFHVPLFLPQMDGFDTTQDMLRQILALHRSAGISAHLEVETYTWDVLPAAYRNQPLPDAIARELNWVRAELQA
ncbi:metabolite traffic protein EboE [Ketogulonicigenium vulgare]|uniref:Sugar phosphate isomerase family enzyme n=1 Tax=Ketogulonicigenium vulgare (strain WSH-001) TaxID=759362 RepID=F9YB67_KETVW|nr:metabolite traffic protein EboE [Ketogulonicigenium vulgare]ADO44095.1 conserved hypothetical protein [Ketogulonicigenium vulgare Y25]AEM42619.1 Sugar phosphate isomerase family enzyme [Ketogulonicigenium vulgare WSH-001]ALJ82643.1 sugar phosphate isomerase [Ketogulonicigenium vulgare]ANW35398.1 sugar phosphate isomerase [Ketogulonicigenium vulgare]AOZ53321.1 hypothetical protein KVC_0295 [Ketogulonicigenium vulgare]